MSKIIFINPYGYLVAIIIAAGVIMFYLLKRGLVERPGSQAEYEPTTREEFEKSFAIPEDKMDAIIAYMNARQGNFDENFMIERKRHGEIKEMTTENYFIELNDEYEVIRDTINSMYVEIGRLSNLAGRELEIKALHDEITPLAARKDEILKILKGE